MSSMRRVTSCPPQPISVEDIKRKQWAKDRASYMEVEEKLWIVRMTMQKAEGKKEAATMPKPIAPTQKRGKRLINRRLTKRSATTTTMCPEELLVQALSVYKMF